MDDYPDPDEEFDLMYGDDLDALRQSEETCNPYAPSNSRRSLDFSSPAIKKISQSHIIQSTQKYETTSDKTKKKDDVKNNHVSQDESVDLNLSGIENISEFLPNSNKRNINDLFGDIDDLELDDDSLHANKKTKYSTDIEQNLALIDKILQERHRKSVLNNPAAALGKDYTTSNPDQCQENISTTIPRWPFIPITKSNGEKVYVRFHNEEYMEREIDEITKSHDGFKSMLNNIYKDDWKRAIEYLEKKSTEPLYDTNQMDTDCQETDINDGTSSQMWVEQYKPMQYIELLSDESTNRTLLQWLKMWDKIVFNRDIKIKKVDISNKFNKRSGKFEFGMNKKFTKNPQENFINELDEHNRPKYKIALLCGPPGCGKTTLAHMIAKHAGYKPVEVNASDDRNVDAFKLALENATQMKSVLDQENRPNCLILDEIDGAPLPAIEYMIKFISGVPMEKAKKGQKAKPHIMKRPIICICNDAYTPSLKPLRQVAFVMHFPPTQTTRLTQRLSEISSHERLYVDASVLTALGEKTNNDIRSCLGILHFFKSKGKQIKLSDVNSCNIGQKDMNKGLFQVWQEIFQIQLPKHKRREDIHEFSQRSTSSPRNNSTEYDANMKNRTKKILNTIYSAGDNEKLMQGVYENYLNMKMKDSMMIGVGQAMDWFIFNDVLNSHINANQNYVLMPYLSYSFVSWHFLFAGLHWPKIKFPTQGFEIYQKQCQMSAITTGIDKGMCPRTKPFMSKNVLILDAMPLLPHIITPSLRPVNVQLYTNKEKAELATVVGVMMDYGIQYVQERAEDGTYHYVLDPDICKVGIFDEKTANVQKLTYATKQSISREVDLGNIKKNELKSSDPVKNTQTKSLFNKAPPKKSEPEVLPNHLQRLQPKTVAQKSVPLVSRDFFGRAITHTPVTAAKHAGKIDEIVKSPIWYHYKEGYNNAVRRDVKISELL